MRRKAVIAILLGLLAGCATPGTLRPAPGASMVPGRKDTAFAVVSDVWISVRGKWKATPIDLPSVLTPVEVTIENRGPRPIRINYRDFDLVGRSGFHYAAVPPLATEGAKRHARAEPAGEARVKPAGFYIGPWSPYYAPGMGYVGAPWSWGDPFFYNGYWSAWQQPLPSWDMVSLALPEGVLQSGGQLHGYLYFNSVRREGVVTFVADVVDADTGRSLGTATIPLDVTY